MRYFLSPRGVLCAQTIGTVEECRSKVIVARVGKLFQVEEYEGSWPKGCYVGYSGPGEPSGIWWNNHPSGSSNSGARQICIRGTEGRIINV